VTGLGAYTCLGSDVDEMWENLINGRSGIRRISGFDATDFPITIAGEVQDFDPYQAIDKDWDGRGDRYCQLGVAAAMQAIRNADLDIDQGDVVDAGVVIANGHGHWWDFADVILDLLDRGEYDGFDAIQFWSMVQDLTHQRRGPDAFDPNLIMNLNYDAPSALVAERLGSYGPRFTISTACASGVKSVERAVRFLWHGDCEMVITGGAESDVTTFGIWLLDGMRALTSHDGHPEAASRPFDQNRDGFVIAEGAAILVLETLEHAVKRKAHIHAEVVGVGGSANAYSLFAPEPIGEGPAGAMEAALLSAGMGYTDVDCIYAHATATGVGDPAEAGGFKMVFKDHMLNVSITATKSMMGHGIGAAGAIGAIQCVKSVETGVIPPIINLDDPDDCCEGLNLVSGSAEERPVKCALNNGFGFGGGNCANIFTRFDGC